MTTKEKRELIITYLRKARQVDRCVGYTLPEHQGARGVLSICDECFQKSSLSTTRLCNQLVVEGILEMVFLRSSQKYYRIREKI